MTRSKSSPPSPSTLVYEIISSQAPGAGQDSFTFHNWLNNSISFCGHMLKSKRLWMTQNIWPLHKENVRSRGNSHTDMIHFVKNIPLPFWEEESDHLGKGHSWISPGGWTAFFMGMFLWLFWFAYLKTTEKAINSNLNNFHAQNYVYGLPADKFMGTSGDQASDTE